ncbi:MAG: 50S ribosomal protein L18 [Candidatus Hydrothermarchaeales archaeon]
MATGPRYRVPFRRKREGKTDYRKRAKLIISGKPRLVIRKSLNHATVQLIEYRPEGDVTITSAHSKELKRHGWKGSTSNMASFYLTGLMCGMRAIKKKQKNAVLDAGLASLNKRSKIFAALKGAIDAGMVIPHGDDVLPEDDRFKGEGFEKVVEKIKSGG